MGVPISAAATASASPLVAATAKIVATTDLSGKKLSTKSVEKIDKKVKTKIVWTIVLKISAEGIKTLVLSLDVIYAKYNVKKMIPSVNATGANQFMDQPVIIAIALAP